MDFNTKKRCLDMVLIFITFVLACTVSLIAESSPGRVSHVEGIASFEHAGEVDWSEVTQNLPVWEGDRFVLQENAFLEIELSDGNLLRLGPETDAVIDQLGGEDRDTVIRLLQGDLILRTHSATPYQILGLVHPVRVLEEGLYRFNKTSKAGSEIIVRKGQLELDVQAGSRKLVTGQVLSSKEIETGLQAVAYGYQNDYFDQWSDRRDARYAGHERTDEEDSYRSYAGSYELDLYGSWGYLSPYGRVWWPRVGSSWSPFRYGRWAHYPRRGWTWISQEPWGWLPYHYGSWYYTPSYGRWCWVPSFSRWSPATVNFFSWNGYVGWSPRVPDAVQRGRQGLITVGPRIQDPHPRGLTIVSREDFVSGRGITDNFRITEGSLPQGLKPEHPPALSDQLNGRIWAEPEDMVRGASSFSSQGLIQNSRLPAREVTGEIQSQGLKSDSRLEGISRSPESITSTPRRGVYVPQRSGTQGDSDRLEGRGGSQDSEVRGTTRRAPRIDRRSAPESRSRIVIPRRDRSSNFPSRRTPSPNFERNRGSTVQSPSPRIQRRESSGSPSRSRRDPPQK